MNGHEKCEIKNEMDNLKALLGKLDKGRQIAKAVHYEASLRNSSQDLIKRQALSKYISNAGNGLHARLEMEIYRLMGETSKYFMGDQVLDLETLKQLVAVLEFWAFLAMGGALGTLLEHKDIQRVWSCGGSAAEVFRAFLDVHKAKRKFGKWTLEHTQEVNFIVHEVVGEYQRGEQDLEPSETSRTKKVITGNKRKPSGQTQQDQAKSGESRGDRSPQGPPRKKPRIVENPSRQNENAQFRKFTSSMWSVTEQNSEALQEIRPKIIFDGPTPSPDKRSTGTAFNQTKDSIQGPSKSSPPKKTQDSDVAKVQPLQSRKPDTSTLAQAKESGANSLNITKVIKISDSYAPELPAGQSSMPEAPVHKSTGDIWEVSDGESDTPEEEAAKEEMKLTAGGISGGCASQIAEHPAGKEKTAGEPTPKREELEGQDPRTLNKDEILKITSNSKIPSASAKPTPSSTSSAYGTTREDTPVQRLSGNLPRFEEKFRTIQKSHADTKTALEAAKNKADEAIKALEGFETKARIELDGILMLDRNAGERWTFEAIRSQASAFKQFGFDKRRELLAVQMPMFAEGDAQKNFEKAEAEYKKWHKKMEVLNQAAEAFDEDFCPMLGSNT